MCLITLGHFAVELLCYLLQEFWEGGLSLYFVVCICYFVRNVFLSLLGLDVSKQTTISNCLNNVFDKG